MATSYLNSVKLIKQGTTEFIERLIEKFIKRSAFGGGIFLGSLALLVGCHNSLMLGGTVRSSLEKEKGRVSQELLVSALMQNVSVNQNSSEVRVTLPYKSRRGAVAVTCELDSPVYHIVEATPCSCSEGVCNVGIRPQADFHGEGSFAFRLIDTEKAPSKLGNVKVKILPVTVSAASGDEQTGSAGTKLPDPLVALVQNSEKVPVEGVTVSWKILDDEGSLTHCTKTSNNQGKAQCNWTLGTKVGVDKISATRLVEASIFNKGPKGAGNSQDAPPRVEFRATVKSGLAKSFVFSKDDYPKPRSVAGKMGPIRISPQDEHGNLAEIQNSSNNLKITLSFKKEPKDEWVLPEKPDQAMTFPWKGGTFSELSLEKVGVYTLKANISGPGSDLNNLETFGEKFEVIPAQATKLVFAQQPGGGIAGAIWTQQPKVQAQDSYENKIPDFASKVKLRIERVGGDPKANTLEREVSADPGVGIATFTDLKINEAGQYILKASSSSLPEVESDPFTITPAMANKLVFTQSPSGCVAGTTWAQQPQVTLQDSYGNEVKSPSVSVTVIIRTSTGDNPIQLPGGTTTLATVNGVASFEGLSFEQAGDYTLTAISSGLLWDISHPFSITPGPANKLSFIEEPKDGKAGEALAPSPKVAIQDKYGNTATNSSDKVTLVIGNNPGKGGFSEVDKGDDTKETITLEAQKGIATFPNLSIRKAGVGYTLKASASGLKEATSSAFDITPGVATHLVFTTQPGGGNAGTAWDQQPVVTIQDDLGNTVTSSSANVTLAIGTNNGEGRLSGTTTVSASNGVATFRGLFIDKSGKGYILTASSEGVPQATSSGFNIIGTPTQLVFTTQPGGGKEGSAWDQQPVVTIQDDSGNTVTSSSANVTLVIGTNHGGGRLSGTTTMSASKGVATFRGLSIDKSGKGYTLTASSDTFSQAISSEFNIIGTSTQLVFLMQPGGGIVGTPWNQQPQVVVQDDLGNTVTNSLAEVTLVIEKNPGKGLLLGPDGTNNPSGRVTVAVEGGIAKFTGLFIEKAGDGYALKASSSGLKGAISDDFNITHGKAKKLGFIQQPKGSIAKTPLSQQPIVAIQDAYGNTVKSSTASVSLDLGKNPGAALLRGGLSVKTKSGEVDYTGFGDGLKVTEVGRGYTLKATSSGLTEAESDPFDMTNGPANKLVFATQPGFAKAGEVFGQQPIVEIRDKEGNRVISGPDAEVTITMKIHAGLLNKDILSGKLDVPAKEGRASWSDLSIDTHGYKQLLARKPDTTKSEKDGVKGSVEMVIISDMFGNKRNPPAVPTNVKATAKNRQVTLSWSASENATSYDVYREEKENISFSNKIDNVLANSPKKDVYTYEDLMVENGKIYYYKVRSAAPGGESELSSAVSAQPLSTPAITSLKVSDQAGSEALEVSWSPSEGASSYTVKHSPTKGWVAVQGTVGCTSKTPEGKPTDPPPTNCVVKNLTPGTVYSFAVRATNERSGQVDSAEVDGIPRQAPTLSLTPGDKQITPIFASVGATSYDLSYGEKSGVYTNKTMTEATSGTPVTELTNEKTYYFKVEAKFPNGSLSSAEQSSAPHGTISRSFNISSATSAEEAVDLVWEASPRANSYKIEYETSSGLYQIFRENVTGTSIRVTGLNGGTTYYFMVTAVNKYGSQKANKELSAVPFGTPAQYVFTVQPSDRNDAGVVWVRQPVVTVQDASGKTVTSFSGMIQLLLQGSNSKFSKFSGEANSIAAVAVNGVATFSGIRVDKKGKYNLLAESPNLQLGQGVSDSFTVKPGPPRRLYTGYPNSSTYSCGPQAGIFVIVSLLDAYGNRSGVDGNLASISLMPPYPEGAELTGQLTAVRVIPENNDYNSNTFAGSFIWGKAPGNGIGTGTPAYDVGTRAYVNKPGVYTFLITSQGLESVRANHNVDKEGDKGCSP